VHVSSSLMRDHVSPATISRFTVAVEIGERSQMMRFRGRRYFPETVSRESDVSSDVFIRIPDRLI